MVGWHHQLNGHGFGWPMGVGERGRLCTDALSTAKRSYPTSEVKGSGRECQAATAPEWPRGATLHPRSGRPGGDTPCPRLGAAAERSYPVPEARGGWEKPPQARGQGQRLEGVSLRPRPEAAAGRSNTAPRSGRCTGAGGPRGAIPR